MLPGFLFFSCSESRYTSLFSLAAVLTFSHGQTCSVLDLISTKICLYTGRHRCISHKLVCSCTNTNTQQTERGSAPPLLFCILAHFATGSCWAGDIFTADCVDDLQFNRVSLSRQSHHQCQRASTATNTASKTMG